MRIMPAGLGSVMITALFAVTIFPATVREDHGPIAWCYVQRGPLELSPIKASQKAGSLNLGRGALAPVLKTDLKKGRNRALVRFTDLSRLQPADRWVDSGQVEITPIDRFPSDKELLGQLGGEYRDEATASKATVVRWLVRQGNYGAALVCFIASALLPVSRLVVFLPGPSGFLRGPSLEFPASEMSPGIVSAEVRDLVGDGNECFITHEPFRQGPEALGVNIVIRRLERGNFRSLWTAPIESRNLDVFAPQPQILHPLEKNVGADGTVTKGEVEFQQHGNTYEPVWNGRVDFFAVGGDHPIHSVRVTKVCAWNGFEFQPLK